MSSEEHSSSAGGGGGSGPTCTDILLPSDEFVVDHWTVQAGSVVRVGETIAYAIHKSLATSGSGSSVIKATTVTAHKRPTRRRRPKPGAATITSTSTSPGKPVTTNPPSGDAALSLKERLTARLAAISAGIDDNDTDMMALEDGSIPTSISVKTTKIQQPEEPSPSKHDSVPIVAPASGLLHLKPSAGDIKEKQVANILEIGYIEECLHPTILDGMCVVCGNPVLKKAGVAITASSLTGKNTLARNSTTKNNTLSQVTVSGGITMTVSEREGQQMAQRDANRLFSQKRLSLVLDLDHTLVHATSDPRAQQFQADNNSVRTIRLPMLEGADLASGTNPHHANMWAQHYIKLRPHVNDLLKGIESTYELTVYTAGTKQYAEEITMLLCRSVVGSTRDWNDVERLRYEVAMGQEEYRRLSGKLKDDEEKKRKIDEVDGKKEDDNVGEPAKKRKKISFGFSEPGNDEGAQKSDHMTKEKLKQIQEELRQADELEQSARDLRQKLFGSRVFSRTDVGDLGSNVKSLKRIFPCGGTMAAVVDDREDVWANAKDNSRSTIKGEPPENLLLVRPYHWQPFVGFADINNAAGADLSGSKFESDPNQENDVQLLWTKDILERLHKQYYQQSQAGKRQTVPEMLRRMRESVLKGCKLVLSGLVPLHKQTLSGSIATRPPIVRYAQSLGATVSEGENQLTFCS